MAEPIRILNVVGRMDRGGIETLIMNVYRHIDRSKVQFDFLAHYGKENALSERVKTPRSRRHSLRTGKESAKSVPGRRSSAPGCGSALRRRMEPGVGFPLAKSPPKSVRRKNRGISPDGRRA